MPMLKMGLGNKADVEAESYETYDGPVPPKGLYPGIARRLVVKKNRNGDMMLNCLVVLKSPEGSEKAKYNGYAIWWNGNVTDQGAGYINQFLDAMSGGKPAVRKAFWEKGPKVDGTKLPAKILAIGPMKIDEDGMPVVVNAKLRPKKGDYEARLEVASWLIAKKEADSDDDDEIAEEVDEVEVVDEDSDEEVVDPDDMTEKVFGDSSDSPDDDDDDDDGDEVPF